MLIETPSTTEELRSGSYIPLNDFINALSGGGQLPYATAYSFLPFLRRYHARLEERGISNANGSGLSVKHSFEEQDNPSSEEIEATVAKYLPELFIADNPVFLSSPFQKDFLYSSPAMQDMLSSGDWELKLSDQLLHKSKYMSIFKVCMRILNKYYHQKIEYDLRENISLRHIPTGLEKDFQVKLDFSQIEVEAIGPLKVLSQEQIHTLLRNTDDQDKWLQSFPPENFSITGFSIGSLVDVTKIEQISAIKDMLSHQVHSEAAEEFLPKINHVIKNFLSIADIQMGFVGLLYAEYLEGISYSLTMQNSISKLTQVRDEIESGGIYLRALENLGPILCEDLSKIEVPSQGESLLLQMGFKSVILFAPKGPDHQSPMIFEIASKTANAFNHLTVIDLREIFQLLQQGSDRYLEETANNISLFIQHQFTSIHPSVHWKFEEVARSFQLRQTLPNFDGEIDEIVFSDVFPLYGQADIVGSSQLRNGFICEDLVDNLSRVKKILLSWKDYLELHLLQALIDQIDGTLKKLETEFTSKDETEVADLLQTEVHPYLKQLVEQYREIPMDAYLGYLQYIDPSLEMVYNRRKDYEQSVTRLNQSISNLLEESDASLQNVLPHYFEKYKTDGIEFNMYVGQSILKTGQFTTYHLKEFRLWQLIQMCEITRLVAQVSGELPVPLRTAQLVFVYNVPLSIRFRMDEKQFDVDGSYNVRYEILKKRIDKAYIKGTQERLTQAGKVAIVYLTEKDRQEYLKYLRYLIDHAWIEKNTEDLELEKLQGAEGLRALRVTVLDQKG